MIKISQFISNTHWRHNYFLNFKTYLKETTLHGLRFIGDHSITVWERGFFFGAFIAAIITTGHLISYIYTKWGLAPVIIGTNPNPTSIANIPFPAITLCNMNQLQLTKVANYSEDSYEGALMDIACYKEISGDSENMPENYKNNNLSIPDFLLEHGPPCSSMFINCQMSSIYYNCSELFHEVTTDEGLCCVFNIMHPYFQFKHEWVSNAIPPVITKSTVTIPVNWSPDFGYQKNLPPVYYPRLGAGVGISMGLTVIVNADVKEYYCSSTNGPGFKIAVQNPLEIPRVRQIGIPLAVGKETRVRLAVENLVSSPNIRSFKQFRHCLFTDENALLYHKSYTRLNCINECQASFIYKNCNCIPYNLPHIYENSTVCGAPHNFCILKYMKSWLTATDGCRSECLPNCCELTFTPTTFAFPIVEGNYYLQNQNILKNFTRQYIRENMAIIHFFYKDFVFYGDIRNTYIGFTEFLSNIGGILALFMGFSFISLAELFYYVVLLPVCQGFKPPKEEETNKQRNSTESQSYIWSHVHPRAERIYELNLRMIREPSVTEDAFVDIQYPEEGFMNKYIITMIMVLKNEDYNILNNERNEEIAAFIITGGIGLNYTRPYIHP